MATEFFMPSLGMNQETGKIIEWLVKEGKNVTKGQPLMVIETDKATVELEAPASGKLVNVTAKDGDEVPVGQVIALIVREGEQEPVLLTPTVRVAPAPPLIKPASPLAARIAQENGVDLSQVPCAGKRIQKEDVLAYLARQRSTAPDRDGKVLASPKARRLAREHNLNLYNLHGSGPEGAVLEMDVMNAVAVQAASTMTEAITETPVLPTSRMWQAMAQRLTESWQTIPHFYLEAEANASQLKAWRARLLERYEEKVSFTDLIVKLVAIALCRHPRLNASWVNGAIHPNTEINIGLAVAVEDGLLVPVIRNADRLGILELTKRRKALVAGAKANRLTLDEISGGTFTISNLGPYGCIENFSAIVNPPEAAILALGGIADKVVPVSGQPAIQPMLHMTLSCDHRVIDGARGAEFLQILVNLIEDPLAALD